MCAFSLWSLVLLEIHDWHVKQTQETQSRHWVVYPGSNQGCPELGENHILARLGNKKTQLKWFDQQLNNIFCIHSATLNASDKNNILITTSKLKDLWLNGN